MKRLTAMLFLAALMALPARAADACATPADRIIEALHLVPLTDSCGGHYAETYRSRVKASVPGARSAATLIYHLIRGKEFADWHRIKSDEIFIYQAGRSARILMIHPDGRMEEHVIGNNIAAGERPQVVVPGNTWMAHVATRRDPRSWCLLGVMVAPGFDIADYSSTSGVLLAEKYPQARKRMQELGLYSR